MNQSRLRSVTINFHIPAKSGESECVTLLEEKHLVGSPQSHPNRYKHYGGEVRNGRTNTRLYFETCTTWIGILSGT